MQHSTLRKVVDERLVGFGGFSQFINDGRANGKTVEDLWVELRRITGISLALRTVYVWLKQDALEQEVAS